MRRRSGRRGGGRAGGQAGRHFLAHQARLRLPRREVLLHSVNMALLGALLPIGAAPRPSNLGVQDYGGGLKTLNLCPPTPNCISTAEEANDLSHYVPAWTYNPEDGRGRKKPATQEQAMAELTEVGR